MNRQDIGAVAAIAALYIGMECLGITCPIRFFTGISCAGCGMSRAWLSFLQCDIRSAFYYHPLFLLVIPGALLFLFRSKMDRKLFWRETGALCGIFLVVYIIRLLNPNDVIVTCAPSEGLIWRILSMVKSRRIEI